MIARFTSRVCTTGAAWLIALAIGSWCSAGDLADELSDAYQPLVEPAKWQVVEESAPSDLPATPVLPVPPQPLPPQPVPTPLVPVEPQAAPAEELPSTPLLDDATIEEELVPPLGADDAVATRRGVRPYGGGRPDDWPWGCGGSPFRTGPGFCDTWDVGCRWDVAVDGMVLMREGANLEALEVRMRDLDFTGTSTIAGDPDSFPAFEQFEYAPGGRVSFISKLPHSPWQMHAGYEGIEEWNASVVFPKTPLPPLPPLPFPPLTPPIDQLAYQQRSLYYRSSLHSGELNFVRDNCSPVWRPYCGVRYVKFDDEINDTLNQEAPPPIPAAPGTIITTDRFNIFDIENNLIGFQIGVRHDIWRPMRRLSLEGFVNAGVYYNKVKHTNFMGEITTEQRLGLGDSISGVFNNDVRELSEISYIAEASLSGVCRLNRCWALRAGYQALWITDLHTAEDAYLNTGIEGRDLFFHGWHAGVEHRR